MKNVSVESRKGSTTLEKDEEESSEEIETYFDSSQKDKCFEKELPKEKSFLL